MVSKNSLSLHLFSRSYWRTWFIRTKAQTKNQGLQKIGGPTQQQKDERYAQDQVKRDSRKTLSRVQPELEGSGRITWEKLQSCRLMYRFNKHGMLCLEAPSVGAIQPQIENQAIKTQSYYNMRKRNVLQEENHNQNILHDCC